LKKHSRKAVFCAIGNINWPDFKLNPSTTLGPELFLFRLSYRKTAKYAMINQI